MTGPMVAAAAMRGWAPGLGERIRHVLLLPAGTAGGPEAAAVRPLLSRLGAKPYSPSFFSALAVRSGS